MHKPHDLFFKETFSNLEVAKSFIENYLPSEVLSHVNLNSLSAQKDSFIHKNMQETHADLLFKVAIDGQEGYIYFLFEHKSYKSHLIALQLLRYMVDIWDAKTRKAKSRVIPIIIPLVIYHGEHSWEVVKSLSGLMPQYSDLSDDLKKYIPNYDFLLYDVAGISPEDMKLETLLKIAITIYQALHQPNPQVMRDTVISAIKALQKLENQETATAYLETYMKYVFTVSKNLDEDDITYIVEQVYLEFPKGGQVVMTLADILIAKGKLKGQEEGMEKGMEKGVCQTVLKLLTKKFGPLPEDIMTLISSQNVESLEMVAEVLLDMKNLDELKVMLTKH